MSKSSILESLKAEKISDIDPRIVPRSSTHIYRASSDRKYNKINKSAKRRIVRLLNIDENHYQVHLPRKKSSEPSTDTMTGPKK